MKLLFDQNLSPKLVQALSDAFPGSKHVQDLGLEAGADLDVWHAAAEAGFCLVSKDSDFHQMSFVFGHPPKVIWIRRGNCSTKDVESLLRGHVEDIAKFVESEEAAFLTIA